jgi:peptidoglycan/LPS O-acetylase OafA/YrhL
MPVSVNIWQGFNQTYASVAALRDDKQDARRIGAQNWQNQFGLRVRHFTRRQASKTLMPSSGRAVERILPWHTLCLLSKTHIRGLAMARDKIGSINGLRGIAIVMVVIFHLLIGYFKPSGPLPPFTADFQAHGFVALGEALLREGWVGVNLFFILSGFVLYLPYRLGDRVMNTKADALTFYRHRAFRLLPLYYIVVLVAITLHSSFPIGDKKWILETGGLFSTLFIASPHGFFPPSNGVLWSVAVEIWFSVLFPFLLFGMKKIRIEWLALASLIVCGASNVIGDMIPITNVGALRPLTNGLLGRCHEFILGMLVCEIYVRMQAREIHRAAWSFGMICAAVSAVAAMVAMDRALSPLDLTSTMLWVDISFSALLLAIVVNGGWVAKVLEIWPLQVLGCACYSIYAWHAMMLNEMIKLTIPMSEALWDALFLLPVLLAFSLLSYRYIEFGHVRDWRALFLIKQGWRLAPASFRRSGNLDKVPL